ncbi:MAG: NAD-dependent epimerase/dehydratase family protein [Hyphomicrobiaceae bacterium]
MEKVLITGGAGFIGSHMCEYFLARGHEVVALDNLSTGRMENIAHLMGRGRFKFVRDSIRNLQVLDRLASESTLLIHLAAAVGVSLILEDAVGGMETNIGGSEDVLRASLRYGLRTIIASSSEVYGKGISVPFSETDDVVLGNVGFLRWSYAISKLADEALALAYHSQHDLPVTVVRFFNTVGPRQTGQYGMVLPRLMGQALKGEPVTVYGDGTQRRCFCDVQDAIVAVYDLAMHREVGGMIFNVGSNEEVSIGELAERIVRCAGSKSTIKLVPYSEAYPPGFDDMMRRVPDISRIKTQIGWEPKLTLDDIMGRIKDDISRRRG